MDGTWETSAYYDINISVVTPNMQQREIPMILHQRGAKCNKRFTRERERERERQFIGVTGTPYVERLQRRFNCPLHTLKMT